MFSEADAYERFMGRWSRLLAPALIAFCEARDGHAVLDVGCGTGALSFAIRDALGEARVTGIDRSGAYVRYAAQQRQDPRLRFAVGDAQRLELDDALFDETVSALVVCFLPEPARAVREMIRVTKRGGVVAAAVWDYGEGMQMLRTFWDAAIALDPTLEARDEARMPLCAKGELAGLFGREGLEHVREASLEVPLRFESFDDYWAPFLLGQGPAGAYVAAQPEDRQRALEARLRERLLGAEADRPIEMRARAWAAKGTVPRP